MRDCPECGGPVEARFHYCPWCSAPQRRKLVEFFRPHEELDSDHGKALRVSRYFGSTEPVTECKQHHQRIALALAIGAGDLD